MTDTFHFSSAKGSIPIEVHPDLLNGSKNESLLSIRYGFRPDSVDDKSPLYLTRQGESLTLEAQSNSNADTNHRFSGQLGDSRDDEYVLVYNPSKKVFVLQALDHTARVNAIRGNALSASSRPALSTPPLSSSPAVGASTSQSKAKTVASSQSPAPTARKTTASKKLPKQSLEKAGNTVDKSNEKVNGDSGDDDDDDDLLGALADELEHSLEEGSEKAKEESDISDASDEDDNAFVKVIGSSTAKKVASMDLAISRPSSSGPISLRGVAGRRADESDGSSSEEE